MISINAVKKHTRDGFVLDIPYLHIEQGERLILIGENGSGKSTLLRLIASMITPDNGTIEFEKQDVYPYYMPQASFGFSMSVKKNLGEAISKTILKSEKEKIISDILNFLELTSLAENNAKRLSGGELQRVALARLLVSPKKLLLLDEPSSSADICGTEIIENALLEYCKKNKTTLIMATHSPSQAMKLATKVLLIKEGKIAETGTPKEFFNNPKTEWGKRFIEKWKI